MEALTYWVQRLEPIIRDESSDEIIVVFCNRTGMEEDAVYAGTSAVIGIHQGEVKVYGLLGRGVKELLMVDTDDPPFANLTIRKKKAYLSSAQYELKPSRQANDDLLLKPSPVNSLERTPTRYHLPNDSPSITTSITPSPSPLSARPRHSESDPSSRSTKDQVGGLDSATSNTCEPGQVFGDSVTIIFEDEGNQSEQDVVTKSSQRSTINPGPSPDRPLPQPPLQQEIAIKSTICVKEPSNDAVSTRSPGPRDVSPQSGRSPVLLDRSASQSPIQPPGQPPGQPPRSKEAVHSRPSTAIGLSPPRPTSPNSRGASSCGRYRRRQSETGQVGGFERDTILQTRIRSAMTPREDQESALVRRRPRSPKSRNVSRSGHRFGFDDGLLERALDSCLATANVRLEPAASETMVWAEIEKTIGEHMRRSKSKDSARGRQRSRSATSNEARGDSGGASPTKRPTRSQTGQGDSITRSCSISSTRAQIGGRATPDGRRTAPPQTRQDLGYGGAIRSVRDPSLGPPSDPEDEIIAEITFRQPCCPSCGSRCASTEASDSRTWERNLRRNQDSVPGHGRLVRQLRSGDESEKTPTNNMTTMTKQDVGILSLQTSADDLNDLRAPNLSRASIRTLSSYEPSPITPPPRNVELRVMKPLILGLDHGSILTSASGTLANVKFENIDASLGKETVVQAG